ncbi:MAG: VOC family protein, partial [Pseudomonadota bacterium]
GASMNKVKTHLMFQGDAEKAIELYTKVFKDFEVGVIDQYKEGEMGKAGSFKTASVNFAGHELIVLDSPPVHKFDFTPSMSLFVDLESAEELDAAFNQLSESGEVLMPLGNYGFSQRFAWFKDAFGVSWQLNQP